MRKIFYPGDEKKRRMAIASLKNSLTFAPVIAEVAQLVEHNLAKVRVAGSSPVFRSFFE